VPKRRREVKSPVAADRRALWASALLRGERKIGALDQAAPLVGWTLLDDFATLRRLLEARLGKPGKREFVQVLRLLEAFRTDDVSAAVRDQI
jgi:hypothetical protein